MTNQTRLLPNELTDAELVEAIHYLDRNRNLTPAEAILAMHVDEQLRRLYVTGPGWNASTFDFVDRAPARPSRKAAKSA